MKATLPPVRAKLDAAVVSALRAFEQHDEADEEAGGVLLGRWIHGGTDFVVDEITTPMKGDRRSRFAFHRAARRHQVEIDRAYSRSSGTCGYLGEWHTHPEPDPHPSSIDLLDWRRRLVADQVDVPALVFVIVGTQRIRMWVGVPGTRSVEPMRIIDDASPGRTFEGGERRHRQLFKPLSDLVKRIRFR